MKTSCCAKPRKLTKYISLSKSVIGLFETIRRRLQLCNIYSINYYLINFNHAVVISKHELKNRFCCTDKGFNEAKLHGFR